MGFVGYLLLGVVAYASGWAIRLYVLEKQPKPEPAYSLKHPTIIRYLVGCFVVMLAVSWAIGRFLLGHDPIDVAYILVNSAVATFVFSFGINPEQPSYRVPD